MKRNADIGFFTNPSFVCALGFMALYKGKRRYGDEGERYEAIRFCSIFSVWGAILGDFGQCRG
ncbi:hypothetical protein DSCO28_29280 [Desulfosarcina ovata subsp. sediminis]|uniref:Uncharacterized protein n=1 Tax=Desulfosarcina ovata subsp. sediminis TaxID=885957 RepID=A0A5K7ZJN8_9BACT|nr:hypothetical protein DSCO28_29280 [Desulfosarcina ovata subsp. sediminis]